MNPEPLKIDQSLKDRVDAIEAMPRSERRKLGKRLGVKIPGSNKPIHYARTTNTSSNTEAPA